MIETWRESWLREFFVNDVYSKKIPADLRDRLFRKLQLLDDASTDADLRVPPSNRFEHLSGKLEGFCSIRVNDKWRLIFQWSEGKATELCLDDHSYRS
ncbi:type II toxin-antitoxin system RelE/ParE family toxin [Granulicella tundricola]|uniref:Plasmid maintenance system killer n=1 Tax=Granulicella tundricola (strain ATCC BAA-1859 / DSM 23138 / MP5ACTX9) TaxID=1198114 RepID=E8X3L3_GRATM|nr:type II toxin-antitoxin system RelE/ParE family toxin [Granulicella tundricola]ADW68204.1 plasmid maintenance system killer [Granulicella tundricola MP5ACTX9]